MRRVVLVGLLAAVLAAGFMYAKTRNVRIVDHGEPYVKTYQDATRGLDGAMAAGDGEAFGALAQDPTMARPEVFLSGRAEAAYRWQRPVLGYLAWAASLGQPGWEPGAQAVIVVLGAAIAVAACGELLRRWRRSPFLAILVLLTPGMLAALQGLTAEPLALALLTLGILAWWARERRPLVAALFFSLAALTRESSLVALVPLGLVELGSQDAAWGDRVRRASALAIPFVVYGAWLVALRARVGAWPVAGRAVRVSAIPFGALVHDAPKLVDPALSLSWLAVAMLLVVAVVGRGRTDALVPIVAAYALFAAVFGTDVWHRWQDFSRPLLPLYAYGMVVVLRGVKDSRKRSRVLR